MHRRASCVPEWLKERYAWYIQGFNICNYTLNALAAWGVAQLVLSVESGIARTTTSGSALAGLAACVTLRGARTTSSLGVMLHLARGHAFRESGLFTTVWIATDLVLAALGVVLAAFWDTNPWLIPLALGPLLVVHRSLSVPALAGRGARRPEDRPLQRPPLRRRSSRRAGARGALRPAAVADHGRPRPPARHQQHLRPPRRRRGAEGHRRGLPRAAPPLRRPRALRRRGVQRSCSRRRRRSRRSRSPSASAARSPRARSTSRPPASRSARPSRSASPRSRSDAQDSNELIHQADLAVYRAKLQGRNRVLGASSEPLLVPTERTTRLVAVPDEGDSRRAAAARRPSAKPSRTGVTIRARTRSTARASSRSRGGSRCSSRSSAPSAAARACSASLFGTSTDLIGLLAVLALVGVGQALALEVDEGSISVSAVGALAGAALFGPRAALAIAITSCVVEWSARRQLAAQRALQPRRRSRSPRSPPPAPSSLRRTTTTCSSPRPASAPALRTSRSTWRCSRSRSRSRATSAGGRIFRERFAWLLPHYVVYGFIGGVIADRLRRRRPARPRRLRRAAAADAEDEGGLPRAHAEERPEAPRGGRDDPDPERVARAGQPAAQGALDRGDGEPLGDRRRARLLHGRPLAPRAAARARDRPRARPLAGRARPARPRCALPRHRQARDPGRRAAQARDA